MTALLRARLVVRPRPVEPTLRLVFEVDNRVAVHVEYQLFIQCSSAPREIEVVSQAAADVRDPAMAAIFRAEVETHVESMTTGLLALERDPGQQKRRLEELMRSAHSIKGAARIVGLDVAGRLAHAMEDCFVAVRDGRLALSAAGVDVLLRAVDLLTRIAERSIDPTGDSSLTEFDAVLTQMFAALRDVLEGRYPPSDGVVRAGSPASPSDSLTGLAVADSGAYAPEAEPPAVETLIAPDGAVILRPTGPLDPLTAEALRQELVAHWKTGERLRLDLSEVRDVSPTGLAVLAGFAQAALASRPPRIVELANAAASLTLLFRAAGLDGVYRAGPPSGEGAQS